MGAITTSYSSEGNIFFIKNLLKITANSPNYITTAGVAFVGYLEISAPETDDGDHLIFETATEEIDMISMDSPIIFDGLHFTTSAPFALLDTYINQLELDLKGNIFLSENYYITKDLLLNRINFEAKEKGTSWNLDVTTFPTVSHTFTVVTTGIDEISTPNYKLVLQLIISEDGIIFPSRVQKQLFFDSADGTDSSFTGYIHQILRSYLYRAYPQVNEASIQVAFGQTCIFESRCLEIAGTDPVDVYTFATAQRYSAILGGINTIDFINSEFLSDYETQVKFLTWQPRIKKITKEEIHFLYFIHLKESSVENYSIKIDIIYSDDTPDESLDVFTTEFYDEETRIYYFECSYEILIAPSASSGNIREFTLTLYDADLEEEISESFRFIFVDDKPNDAYYLFANSFECYDSIRTRGEQIRGIQLEGEVLQKHLPSGYTLANAQYEMLVKPTQKRYKQNTGYLDSKQLNDYLAELTISNQIFQLRNGNLIPGMIVPKNFELSADNASSCSMEFEFIEAYDYIGESQL